MADPTSRASGSTAYADARRRYRLDSRIATGGMGEVWRATDTVLDRPVAVKLLKQEHADDTVFRARFETEAQHAAVLHHPGVAQVYDFGTGDEQHPPYLVMEYVEGQPLSAILRPGQPMEPAAAAFLIAATGEALGAAHAQGIVHRDVKPANILVTGDRQVKITDFGIARAADAVALTRTGEVLGTPQYISPEQAEGRRATPASDVYSLGAVAFECLAGRRPFEADSPVATALAHLRQPVPELPSTVPPALAAVVRRAMAKAPGDRYADGTLFAGAVRDAAATPALDEPAATKVMAAVPALGAGAAAAEPGSSRARRVPLPVWAAAGVLVLVVAVAALAASTAGGDSSPGTGTTTPPSTPASSAAASPGTSAVTSPVTGPTTSEKTPAEGDDHGNNGNQGNGNGHGDGHGHGNNGNGHEHGKGHQ